MAEHRTPNPGVGGSSPSWPAIYIEGQMVEKFKVFFEESRAELAKVTWPDRKTTAASTVVVVGLSLMVGLYLGLLDFILNKVFKIIFS